MQEPYSSVGYLCERVSFLSALKLQHPSLQDSDQDTQPSEGLRWTAWDVCEGQYIFLTKLLIVVKKIQLQNVLKVEFTGVTLRNISNRRQRSTSVGRNVCYSSSLV